MNNIARDILKKVLTEPYVDFYKDSPRAQLLIDGYVTLSSAEIKYLERLIKTLNCE